MYDLDEEQVSNDGYDDDHDDFISHALYLISELHTKAHSGYQFRLSNRKKKIKKNTLPTPPLLFSQPNLGGSRSQKKKI